MGRKSRPNARNGRKRERRSRHRKAAKNENCEQREKWGKDENGEPPEQSKEENQNHETKRKTPGKKRGRQEMILERDGWGSKTPRQTKGENSVGDTEMAGATGEMRAEGRAIRNGPNGKERMTTPWRRSGEKKSGGNRRKEQISRRGNPGAIYPRMCARLQQGRFLCIVGQKNTASETGRRREGHPRSDLEKRRKRKGERTAERGDGEKEKDGQTQTDRQTDGRPVKEWAGWW